MMAALEHATNALCHAFGLVVCVGDDDFETFLNGLILEVLDELWKKGISDVGND